MEGKTKISEHPLYFTWIGIISAIIGFCSFYLIVVAEVANAGILVFLPLCLLAAPTGILSSSKQIKTVKENFWSFSFFSVILNSIGFVVGMVSFQVEASQSIGIYLYPLLIIFMILSGIVTVFITEKAKGVLSP